MEPENASLGKEEHLRTTSFGGSMLVLGGVDFLSFREGSGHKFIFAISVRFLDCGGGDE